MKCLYSKYKYNLIKQIDWKFIDSQDVKQIVFFMIFKINLLLKIQILVHFV